MLVIMLGYSLIQLALVLLASYLVSLYLVDFRKYILPF